MKPEDRPPLAIGVGANDFIAWLPHSRSKDCSVEVTFARRPTRTSPRRTSEQSGCCSLDLTPGLFSLRAKIYDFSKPNLLKKSINSETPRVEWTTWKSNTAMANSHNESLAEAFDGQAALFEKAPVQTDPEALQRLMARADFSTGSLVFDAGCGPGLVSLALLECGHRVVGVDLSHEMIERARARCASFGERAQFERRSVTASQDLAPFDGSISRYVLHHVVDPLQFLQAQVALLRPGGVLVLSDHTTDPDESRAEQHTQIERLRDRTHTRNLTAGGIVDLFAQVGLIAIQAHEERFTLDFDEWFDRGTPEVSKAEVRQRLRALPPIRGFQAVAEPSGQLTIHCWRSTVRGVVPGAG